MLEQCVDYNHLKNKIYYSFDEEFEILAENKLSKNVLQNEDEHLFQNKKRKMKIILQNAFWLKILKKHCKHGMVNMGGFIMSKILVEELDNQIPLKLVLQNLKFEIGIELSSPDLEYLIEQTNNVQIKFFEIFFHSDYLKKIQTQKNYLSNFFDGMFSSALSKSAVHKNKMKVNNLLKPSMASFQQIRAETQKNISYFIRKVSLESQKEIGSQPNQEIEPKIELSIILTTKANISRS